MSSPRWLLFLLRNQQIKDTIHSLYWWNGAVQEDDETAFFAKTGADMVDRTIERIREHHSYECPCVIALPIENGNPEFLKWITDNTH
ncbi:MAG: divalent cation tolerance protein CutA [Chitinivibrionales bacterium]|nr:divalent cation tolerance protein CutA [Chitinivibrionales bacterium]MBD3358277.1 divalent cation tolerance protein CutA [Chitinivibrionales bacterium]